MRSSGTLSSAFSASRGTKCRRLPRRCPKIYQVGRFGAFVGGIIVLCRGSPSLGSANANSAGRAALCLTRAQYTFPDRRGRAVVTRMVPVRISC